MKKSELRKMILEEMNGISEESRGAILNAGSKAFKNAWYETEDESTPENLIGFRRLFIQGVEVALESMLTDLAPNAGAAPDEIV